MAGDLAAGARGSEVLRGGAVSLYPHGAEKIRLGVMPVDNLRASPMMAHLMDALDSGADIGHYGRLVFTVVARYFISSDEVVRWLLKNPGFSEHDAASLIHQVASHDYSPPTRRRVLEWQAHQDFPICPNPGDPDGCNVYRDLVFPDEVYERIEDYHYQKVRPEASATPLKP